MIFRRAILAAVLVAGFSTACFSEDCLMGRYGPDQRSYTPEKLQLPVSMLWEHTGSKYDNNPASPVVAGNFCYFACGDRLYAVELETGKLVWKYPSDQPLGGSIKATPATDEGRVYLGATDGNLYCIDGLTGTFQWAYQTRGSIRCPPVIQDGVVYFGTDDNSVYAVDAVSGDLAWTKPFTARDDMAQGVALGVGMLVVACMDGNLYGINAGSGKLRWGFRMPAAPVRTSPIMVDNVVVMALGNVVYGVTARSGQLRWVINLPSEVAATPASDGPSIYVPCRDKKIYAYTLTGRQPSLKWTEPADLGSIPMSSPTVADDMLVMTGSKGVIAAFSTVDGSLKWRYIVSPAQSAGSAYTDAASSPVVANGALMVLTDDGVLHCFASGAPDSEPPVVYDKKPMVASAIPAVPPFKLSAILYDIGSGVDYSTVTMSLDGQPVDYQLDFATSTISAVFDTGPDGKPVKRLSDGIHKVILLGKDYAGNQLNEDWFFYADSSLQPPKKPVKEEGKKTREPARGNRATPIIRPNQRTPDANDGGIPSPPPPPPMPGAPNGPDANAPAESGDESVIANAE